MKVDNAIVMAAGMSSRFAPLSYEKPKALVKVRGEVLIERQIKQLKEAKIPNIIIIVGYKAEQFFYLQDKYDIKLIFNEEYGTRNNNGSIWAAREMLGNSYVCSADNYFITNPFEVDVDEAYYAAEYAVGKTDEWCITQGVDGYINSVSIGGNDSWYMMGHTFWDNNFSRSFLKILEREYLYDDTRPKLWEQIYKEHLDELKMRIRKYDPGIINEFDTIDELRTFDTSYIDDTGSNIIKRIASELGVNQRELTMFSPVVGEGGVTVGFDFVLKNTCYTYLYGIGKAEKTDGRIG